MTASLDNVLLIGILNRLAMNYETGGLTPSSKVDQNTCSIWYDENNAKEDGTYYTHPIINGIDGKAYNDIFDNVRFQVSFDCDPEYPDKTPLVTAEIDDDLIIIIENGTWYV